MPNTLPETLAGLLGAAGWQFSDQWDLWRCPAGCLMSNEAAARHVSVPNNFVRPCSLCLAYASDPSVGDRSRDVDPGETRREYRPPLKPRRPRPKPQPEPRLRPVGRRIDLDDDD